jgi:hypothetical protein
MSEIVIRLAIPTVERCTDDLAIIKARQSQSIETAPDFRR